jgi:hypothetical protein
MRSRIRGIDDEPGANKNATAIIFCLGAAPRRLSFDPNTIVASGKLSPMASRRRSKGRTKSGTGLQNASPPAGLKRGPGGTRELKIGC